MSKALIRRNSSKEGLQNLMRLTAQRSVEDAEEIERERRRRLRESSRWSNGVSLPETDTLAEESMYDGGLKPRSSPSLEEDEGFSDWTQRREKQRQQQRLQKLGIGTEEEDDEELVMINKTSKTNNTMKPENTVNKAVPERIADTAVTMKTKATVGLTEKTGARALVTSTTRLQRQERGEEVDGVEMQRPNAEVEKRKEVKISFTSKVFVQHDANGHATKQEVTSHSGSKTKRATSRVMEPEESVAILETEQRLVKIRQSLQQKENQELEHLRQRQAVEELELEELQRKREQRRRGREEEDRRREGEEQLRIHKEEEERKQMKEDIERRRSEAAQRIKSLSTSSSDGDEMFSPFSPKAPTHKITERTESLNRSLKKSNSFKKTQPLVLLPKIDDKLEQYAHAVETSHEVRSVKALSDLPSSPEVVAAKKNLFEAGDVWSQSPTKAASCKDVEGLKVGVAGLITQWVKGPGDDSRQSPSKPADVKPGDVMQKKNMWEGIRDSSSGQHSKGAKNSAVGKKYKFIVTGHGKYEKIPVDDEDRGEFTNGKNDLYHDDY